MEKPRYYYPGEKPYRMIYMEGLFGNIVEIYSHSYELIYSESAAFLLLAINCTSVDRPGAKNGFPIHD